MREFGVRRYGDTVYQHCLADSASDAADWFAHSQAGVAGKDFQALVKDVALPVADETGRGVNPQVVPVKRGAGSAGGRSATDLKRTSRVG